MVAVVIVSLKIFIEEYNMTKCIFKNKKKAPLGSDSNETQSRFSRSTGRNTKREWMSKFRLVRVFDIFGLLSSPTCSTTTHTDSGFYVAFSKVPADSTVHTKGLCYTGSQSILL